jgi:hypothetical protein
LWSFVIGMTRTCSGASQTGKLPGIMLQQEADMRSCVLSGARWMHSGTSSCPSLVRELQVEALRHGKVHLVRRQRELAPDGDQICTSILGP